MGLETEILGPAEIREDRAGVNTDGILGALYDPLDGHLDPSGTTHAYAKAARMGGATIELHCKVTGTDPAPRWQLGRGDRQGHDPCRACGQRRRSLGARGRRHGRRLSAAHPMAHQYLVTDDIPEIYERGRSIPHVMDPAGESYLRQEGRGLCIGFYEQKCEPWAVDGTPWEFGHELLPDRFRQDRGFGRLRLCRFPGAGTGGRQIG
jgi:dimethylglycine dehydrogenase